MTPDVRYAPAACRCAVGQRPASARPAPVTGAASVRVPVAAAAPASAATEGFRLGCAAASNPDAACPGACSDRAIPGHPLAAHAAFGPVAPARAHPEHGAPPNASPPEPHATVLPVVADVVPPNAVRGGARPLDDAPVGARLPRSVSPNAASVHVACVPCFPYTGFYGICPIPAMAYVHRDGGLRQPRAVRGTGAMAPFHASRRHRRRGAGEHVPRP